MRDLFPTMLWAKIHEKRRKVDHSRRLCDVVERWERARPPASQKRMVVRASTRANEGRTDVPTDQLPLYVVLYVVCRIKRLSISNSPC
jgi:hypothetical protein